MAIYPEAKLELVKRPDFARRAITEYNRVNLHTAVSDAASLYGWFNQNGKPLSHFYVNENGIVIQYLDTKYRAAADLEANDATISVETWDGGKPNSTPWNAKQVAAITKLIVWLNETHGIKLVLAKDSNYGPTSHGVSWHRLGCPYRGGRINGRRVLSQVRPGYMQHITHMMYTTSSGKVCPGDLRIAQIPGIVKDAKAIVAGEIKPTPKPPAPKPPAKPKPKPPVSKAPVLMQGPARSDKYVKNLQDDLNRVFPSYSQLKEDNSFGPATRAVVREFQRQVGLTPDGVVGPKTWAKLEKYGITPEK